MLGYVGILLFIRLLSLLLRDGGLSMEFKIEPSKSIFYNSNLFSTIRKIYVLKSNQLTKLHSPLPPYQINHLREEYFPSARSVVVVGHPYQMPNPTSGIGFFCYMIHEYRSVWVHMVGMFHSALICCRSRIPMTCLLLWFPVRRRVHVLTCLFRQALNVCYLGVNLPHSCRIDCRCQSYGFGCFRNWAIGSIRFVINAALTTCFSCSGSSVVTLLLVTISFRHFQIIYSERQHLWFISTTRYSFTNWRFHDFVFPPRCE